jgi:hypothetical protein
MEFRLIHQGPLPAEGGESRRVVGAGGYGRARDKHRLRKHFHLQLRELWHQDGALKTQAETYFVRTPAVDTLLGHVDPEARAFRKSPPNEVGAKNTLTGSRMSTSAATATDLFHWSPWLVGSPVPLAFCFCAETTQEV